VYLLDELGGTWRWSELKHGTFGFEIISPDRMRKLESSISRSESCHPSQPVWSPGLALTVRHLQGTAQNVADLSAVRVGAVSGSSTVNILTRITKLVMANTAVVNIEDHLAFH
jgi:hypothetical protein